jgi:hypothetical protein
MKNIHLFLILSACLGFIFFAENKQEQRQEKATVLGVLRQELSGKKLEKIEIENALEESVLTVEKRNDEFLLNGVPLKTARKVELIGHLDIFRFIHIIRTGQSMGDKVQPVLATHRFKTEGSAPMEFRWYEPNPITGHFYLESRFNGNNRFYLVMIDSLYEGFYQSQLDRKLKNARLFYHQIFKLGQQILTGVNLGSLLGLTELKRVEKNFGGQKWVVLDLEAGETKPDAPKALGVDRAKLERYLKGLSQVDFINVFPINHLRGKRKLFDLKLRGKDQGYWEFSILEFDSKYYLSHNDQAWQLSEMNMGLLSRTPRSFWNRVPKKLSQGSGQKTADSWAKRLRVHDLSNGSQKRLAFKGESGKVEVFDQDNGLPMKKEYNEYYCLLYGCRPFEEFINVSRGKASIAHLPHMADLHMGSQKYSVYAQGHMIILRLDQEDTNLHFIYPGQFLNTIRQ